MRQVLRAAFPFVHVSADTLPTDATRFSEACASLLDVARGGTLLITNVEAMPAVVQESLIETLAQLQAASDPVDAVRPIAGTTVILHVYGHGSATAVLVCTSSDASVMLD